ncbi:hypothetical protein PVAND_015134 [Polypedilum vanderplanki]|uniref:Tyrosine-protein kinase receptor n=1 Tax=Polypedilum vanderplanki TaxID=319348 RepID=A0A9J6BB81_POLVA|nr:hypothetical protein PVAND_015134 [Polypedilum vanderplanki]
MQKIIKNKSHTRNLPRGYYKRKKPPDECTPSVETCQTSIKIDNYFSLRCKFSDNRHVNTKFHLFYIISLLIIVNATAEDLRLKREIENFSKTTPTPLTLPNDGICKSIDVRFYFVKIHSLTGCRVVEGSITILMMDEITPKDVANITFPELVEVTGFIMLYRVGGFTSLNQLFPNLSVIRGRDLFKDYSLVIYEMIHLEEIGLKNLMAIERGNVRIEKNELMCFSKTINWKNIIIQYEDPYIEKNRLPAHCPNCQNDKCPKSIDGKNTYCWNIEHCQRTCSHCQQNSKKGEMTYCSPNQQTCCDHSCIGGCEDDKPKNCFACRKFAYGTYPNIECLDKCPNGTFAHLERRCLTRDQCYDLNNDSVLKEHDATFIPFEKECRKDCPPNYRKVNTGRKIFCQKCQGSCLKECRFGNLVDSIEAAQSLKGCNIIEGPLEIQIRGITKSPESGRNIVKELESSLSDIQEIKGYLKIARSHAILSMSFLKNLRKIHGNSLEGGRNAIMVWENQNLQELWDESHRIEIVRGKLFFHFNPKLCFYKIEQLARKSAIRGLNASQMIENYETAKISNGDKTPCNLTPLNVTVDQIFPQAALLTWDPLKLEDERSLLNYVVYYIAAPYTNVTLWDGRDACGDDGWSVEDVNDFRNNKKVSQPLTKLEPYTQYAYYVKAYTLATEKTGAQSEISYFTTKPDVPEVVKKFKLTVTGPDKIEVSWETLKKVNGRLDHYILRANAIPQDDKLLLQRDYCKEPIDTSPPPSPPSKDTLPIRIVPKNPNIAPDGVCDCPTCSKLCSEGKQLAPQKGGFDERQLENDFEDDIQDYVYVRTDDKTTELKDTRTKRQVPNEIEFPSQPIDPSNPFTVDRETMKNTSDFYFDEIGPETTTFTITGLNHYTTYNIRIRACRKREEGESFLAEICGPEMKDFATTFRELANDNIPNFYAEQFVNNSLTNIRITWEQPADPNGLLLAYTIRHKRVDIEHTQPVLHCISTSMLNGTNYYILQKVTPGNYSIDMMATSMAGNGNYTNPKYVFIKEQSQYTSIWTIIAILFIVFIIGTIGLIWFFKKMYLSNISNMKLIANVNPDYAGVTYRQDEWEIPREKIIQLQELGCGSFGMVYEGLIKDFHRKGEDVRCAIKTVNESATDKEQITFLNEASVMKQFDTHHVVRLLGVVSIGQPTLVVMELMASGDLKSYLRSHRPEYDTVSTEPPPQPPTLRRILQMAIEIADGMAYLSAKKFVHRDLAARNCMVAEDLTVKIGDFGMTRDIYETDYYRKGTKGLLPVRWMSPESLKDGVFSSSSDVFSYGVVVWEMSTLAQQPYAGLSNDQVLRYVIEGGVMERPENCPDKLYDLMRRCWQHRPSARPTFMDIITMLLDSVSPEFEKVSFFHSPDGVEIRHQMALNEVAVFTDDVTTPLRHDEDSIIDRNNILMENMSSQKSHYDDDL